MLTRTRVARQREKVIIPILIEPIKSLILFSSQDAAQRHQYYQISMTEAAWINEPDLMDDDAEGHQPKVNAIKDELTSKGVPVEFNVSANHELILPEALF